jgi:hypothetical protein
MWHNATVIHSSLAETHAIRQIITTLVGRTTHHAALPVWQRRPWSSPKKQR